MEITLSITSEEEEKTARSLTSQNEGIGIWLLKEQPEENVPYFDTTKFDFFGYTKKYNGLGIILQPMGDENYDIIAGALNSGEEEINTMKFTKRFCKFKMFNDDKIPIKIALVAGGLMVYTKEDDSDKFNLCFGIPEAGSM
jgi:hypothetical protein